MKNAIQKEQENRLSHFISVFSSIFSHEQANSLLTRHFPECKAIPHKTDCMVQILDTTKDTPDLFFSNIALMIRLHSNILNEKPQLQSLLNNELKLLGLKYDESITQLVMLENFEPYLMLSLFLEIDQTYIPDQFYKNLIQEINWCYATRAYSATLILVRKLFENLTLDLLRKKFQNEPEKEFLFWKKGGFPRFYNLIENLKENLVEFSKFSSSMTHEVIDFLHHIRMKGNKSAHTIENLEIKSKLDFLMVEITKYGLLFFAVFRKLK